MAIHELSEDTFASTIAQGAVARDARAQGLLRSAAGRAISARDARPAPLAASRVVALRLQPRRNIHMPVDPLPVAPGARAWLAGSCDASARRRRRP